MMMLFVHAVHAQQTVDLSGRVLDENGGSMPGVVLHIGSGNQHVTTDSKGEFRIYGLPEGEISVHAHFLGYEIYADTIVLTSDVKNYVI